MQARKSTFKELSEHIHIVSDKIREDRNPKEDKSVSLNQFWFEFEKSVNGVSSECTKLSLAFSSHPYPSSAGCETFRERLESSILLLISVLYKFPGSIGQRLKNSLFDYVLEILNTVNVLVQVIGENAGSCRQLELQSTGGVWEVCEKLPTLPKSDKEVAVRIASQQLALVKDALKELEDEIEDKNEDNSEESFGDSFSDSLSWTDIEKTLLGPTIGLIKVTRSTIKKLSDALKSSGLKDVPNHVSDLDASCEILEKLSPQVDNIIEEVYPPVCKESLLGKVQVLYNTLKSLFLICPQWHFVSEEDQSWVDFLTKALEHNYLKLSELCVGGSS